MERSKVIVMVLVSILTVVTAVAIAREGYDMWREQHDGGLPTPAPTSVTAPL